jgi:hypothetical protein
MRHAIMSKEGQLVYCELHEWAQWFENGDNRRIASDKILGIKVSTVFLGLNHSYGDGPDQWFETMIFGPAYEYEFNGKKHWTLGHDIYCERYETFAQAKKGHAIALKWLQDRLDLSDRFQLCLPASDVLGEVYEGVPVSVGDILTCGDPPVAPDH